MASFVRYLMRLAGGSKRRRDEEEATTAYSVMGSSTLPPSHIHTTRHRVAGDDALALFRLTLGIMTAPHLGFSGSAHRPANNIGLYARVVHSEHTAKHNYKVFSAILNACYFLQIIVAAALTALGAANADNKAITAFGSINTVLAGFLAYLKGSGYPSRLKYYANEWKKIREFIEHRERDFSLEGCTLDVYEVVETVREMYDTTKREIEMNTPDSYNSRSNMPQLNGVDTAKAEAIAGKLRGLDDTVRKLRTHMGSVPMPVPVPVPVPSGVEVKSDDVMGTLHGLGDTIQHLGSRMGVESKAADVAEKLRSVEDALDKVRARGSKTVDDGYDAAHNTVDAIQDEEKRMVGELRGFGQALVRGLEEHTPRPPREVSITLSHRDGNDQTDGSGPGARK